MVAVAATHGVPDRGLRLRDRRQVHLEGTTPPQGAAVLSLPTGDFALQANWSNDANAGAGDCRFTHPIVTTDPNLALHQPVTASSSVSGYPASNTTDGNTASYWESNNNSRRH
jgi:hypothetical protein